MMIDTPLADANQADISQIDMNTSPGSVPSLAASPIEPTPLSDIIAALRTITELDGLTEDEYAWIGRHSTERMCSDGAILFKEGEPSHHLHFILRGDVQVHRRNSGPVSLYIGRTGRVTGKAPFSRMKTWGGSGYASGEMWVLDMHEDLFAAMLLAIPSMAQRCVSMLLDRVREFTRADEQTSKLSALGKLAANLAHELNNPASAARSAAVALSSGLDEEDEAKYQLGYLCESKEELEACRGWMRRAWDRIATKAEDTSIHTPQLGASDQEDALLSWLGSHEIRDAWAIAPTLAEAGLPIELLDELAARVSARVLPLVIANFAGSVRSRRTASTVIGSTSRIFDIITAIKDYSYMDQAPMQDVNIAQSLENTLAMLQSRLGNVTIERDYATDLPTVRAFGSELNQVWTALIENALDAMRNRGHLRLSTRFKAEMAFVEVSDNGPGVDPAIKARIFEPFFTTKPLGAGLGLGLDMVQRIVGKHFGSVNVESSPSATCFQVRLPFDRMKVY
jgi:signal transduction histidine kinase